jgi:hypothetical protein
VNRTTAGIGIVNAANYALVAATGEAFVVDVTIVEK